jgi:hypothetical protein
VKRARELIYTAERQASRDVSLAGLSVKNAGLWQWNGDDIDDDDCVVGDVSLRSHS